MSTEYTQEKIKSSKGLYKRKYIATGTVSFVGRIRCGGQDTWKTLAAKTRTAAEEEWNSIRFGIKQSCTPGEVFTTKTPYFREIIQAYEAAGYPGQNGPLSESSLRQTKQELPFITRYLGHFNPCAIRSHHIGQFCKERMKRATKGPGTQIATHARSIIIRILNFGAEQNPAVKNNVGVLKRIHTIQRHAKDRQPKTIDEWHDAARKMFEDPESETCGWLTLIAPMVGLRRSELLALRADACNRESPGYIEEGEPYSVLWLARRKGGDNPWVQIYPELKECLRAHSIWRAERFPDSPWWFPSPRNPGRPVCPNAFNEQLKKKTGYVTPHSLRAMFATMMRELHSNNKVAAMLGQRSGEGMMLRHYGKTPEGWISGKKRSWLPANGKPAWSLWLPNIPTTPKLPRADFQSAPTEPDNIVSISFGSHDFTGASESISNNHHQINWTVS